MYFNLNFGLMYNFSSVRHAALYFTFAMYLSILCHTVDSTSHLVSSHQNESLSNDIKLDQLKREDKNNENVEVGNKNRNINTSENKLISPGLNNNGTVLDKPPLIDDELNSTASLPSWVLNIKEGALQRTGYVALGFMSIVLIFFVVRAVRLRQKRSKSRKYGIITSTVSDMEMEPLDKDDDEEEDTTLFDAQHKYSLH